MARSLAKIHLQIAKLQQEADSIQTSVIARIRKEIAQHGLTADHLFGSSARANAVAAKASGRKGSASKSGEPKPAKYADGQGNTWHGIGKRPNWIHAALDAGGALQDFLVKDSDGGKASDKAMPKRAAAARKASKVPEKKPAAKKSATKPAAKKKPLTEKAPAKTAARTRPAAKPVAKKASFAKATAKKTSGRKTEAASASASAPDAVVAAT